MASSHGINVEIRSGRVPLQCYEDPEEATNRKPGEVRKYIEATTDAKFEAALHLTRDFNIGQCDGVKISYILDGQCVSSCFVYKSDIVKGDDGYRAVRDSSKDYCKASEVWKRVKWSFGKLDIQETTDTEYCPQQLEQLGSITLRIRRVYRKERFVRTQYPDYSYSRISDVPEKLLKGRAICNSVRLVEGTIIPKPEHSKRRSVYINGPLGDPMDFTFLYRSKHALQILGCIPREPSPDDSFEFLAELADQNPATAKPESSGGDLQRDHKIATLRAQQHELQAQIGILERNPNIKPELVASAASTASTSGTKREYDGIEILSERKRSRPSRPIETIDLTDD